MYSNPNMDFSFFKTELIASCDPVNRFKVNDEIHFFFKERITRFKAWRKSKLNLISLKMLQRELTARATAAVGS